VTATPAQGLYQVTRGYLEQILADGHVVEPPAVHGYYNAVARRLRETWRPGFYRTPDMVDALMAMPRRMAAYAERYRRRAEYYARTGRPDDPTAPTIPDDFEERSTFSTRTTVSIVEVEQDDAGRVLSIRVVRPARIRSFDQAALDAVRDGLPNQAAVPLPGGRRSRFAFEVVVSRDAVVPVAGFAFNESTGFFEMHYPGALHVRTRVRPLGSRALSTPWPVPRRAD
jgi:hypothetical protein